MNRRLLVASLFATLLAGCQLSDKTEGPVAACMDVGSACTENRACCSYGCVQGFCMANPEDGGQCRTSDDCASGACRNGRCDQSAACRDESDRCDWDGQCCTGTCNAAWTCVQNGAPTVVATSNANAEGKLATGTAIVFDARGSSDPDGDYLSYGWQVIRVPSLTPVACANGSASATCTISAPQLGAYRAVVTVTDGKVDPAPQGTVGVEVVNLPPIVQAMTISDQTPSRNVAFTVGTTVVDPDGDPLSCTWTSTAPGGTPQPIAGATSCSSLSFTAGAEGAWAFTIQPDDGVENAPVASTVTATVINDVPVVTTINGATVVGSAANVYGNMGATEATTPEVALAAAATDLNSDDPLAFQWTLTSGPGVQLSAPTAAATTFVPPTEGTYVFTVTATDPAAFDRAGGASAAVTVTVHVDRYVRDLGHLIVDADRAIAAEKAVLVGPLPGSTTRGALWVLDLASQTESAPIELAAPPKVVGVSPDGTWAVAATDLFYWIVNLTTREVSTGYSTGMPRNDIVVTGTDQQGKRRAFLFPVSSSSWSVGVVDLATGTLTTGSHFGIAGALDPVLDRLYTVDASYVQRYALANNGVLNGAGYATKSRSESCATIWSSRRPETNAFTGCGEIVSITPSTSLVSVSGSLGGNIRHVDTAANGAGIFADATGTVRRFTDALMLLPASDPLPTWASAGRAYPTSARWVFVSSDATPTFWTIVSADGASGGRYGLIRLQ
jgi:hypothetical protein